MPNLKKEFNDFLKEIEKNIKKEDDVKFIKEKTADLFYNIIEEFEKTVDSKEALINLVIKKQQDIESKMDKMRYKLENIEDEIGCLDNNDLEAEIECPYCEAEIILNLEEECDEIECPECDNIIELDWEFEIEENKKEQENSELECKHIKDENLKKDEDK